MSNKIGIITFHLSENYGAMLQAFALRYVLRREGAEADVINYSTDYTSGLSPLRKTIHHCWLLSRYVFGYRSRLNKARNFRIARMGVDKSYLAKKICEVPHLESFDRFVVGSDQVWNLKITNDPVFRLTFAKESQKKFSYAASLGNDIIEKSDESTYKKSLSSFKGISVRESSGVNALASIGIKAQHVLDPTLLLSAEDWVNGLELASTRNIDEKYVFCYVLPGNATSAGTVREARKLAKLKGLKLIVVGEREHHKLFDNAYKTDVGVEEFVNYIKDAEFVVTNSFHGTCFSIIFNKEFYTTILPNNKRNSRIVELLAPLRLEDRILDLSINSTKEEGDTINYKDVSQNLALLKLKSMDFVRFIVNS